MRIDGREFNQIREIEIIPDFNRYSEGSVLIKMGNTQVICTATVDASIPKWLQGTGTGWLTAEYGMLPRSTHQRMKREKTFSGGRTQEISRLIGRSLRAALDMKKLGERQIFIDCDVIQADGGTRTAAITGAYVALSLAVKYLLDQGTLKESPIIHQISAISVGLKENQAYLDLNYDEDSNIETDMNFVLTESGDYIEIQGTAEGTPFNTAALNQMMEFAQLGCKDLFVHQKNALNQLES